MKDEVAEVELPSLGVAAVSSIIDHIDSCSCRITLSIPPIGETPTAAA